MESFISIFLLILGVYLLIGFIFSIAFLFKGLVKVDPVAKGSNFFFKLLLIPGICFFWIILLPKWLKSNRT